MPGYYCDMTNNIAGGTISLTGYIVGTALAVSRAVVVSSLLRISLNC